MIILFLHLKHGTALRCSASKVSVLPCPSRTSVELLGWLTCKSSSWIANSHLSWKMVQRRLNGDSKTFPRASYIWLIWLIWPSPATMELKNCQRLCLGSTNWRWDYYLTVHMDITEALLSWQYCCSRHGGLCPLSSSPVFLMSCHRDQGLCFHGQTSMIWLIYWHENWEISEIPCSSHPVLSRIASALIIEQPSAWKAHHFCFVIRCCTWSKEYTWSSTMPGRSDLPRSLSIFQSLSTNPLRALAAIPGIVYLLI